jgi:ATP-dependent Clp protease ATP-binding subunit ClpA
MLSKDLERTLHAAFRQAKEARHQYVTLEHLLLALTEESSTIEVLRACGARLPDLQRDLAAFIEETTPVFPPKAEVDSQPTLGFQRVLQRAVFHAQSAGRKEVKGSQVLAAMFSEPDSQAVYLLGRQDISRLDVVNYISHGVGKEAGGDDEPSGAGDPDQAESREAPVSPLARYASNLNEQASQGKIDPLIGRAPEMERMAQVLCRRRKNNPLLVGEAGVGKTALAEGLARRIVDGEVPDVLKGAVVYALDLGALVAGTKYRGDFEKRLKGVLAALKEEPGAILFIDEIHTLIGAGSASGSAMDASNLIKPMLAAGELRCIGSTTYQEFRRIFEKDHALTRRFQKIDVPEPAPEEAVEILKGLKSRFEEHHQVRYTQEALRAAVDLSARYIGDRHLPDKAIDVIDEAGASQQLKAPSRRKKTIGVAEVEDIVARIARVPPRSVSASDKTALATLERDLKLVIFGQDAAVGAVVSAIKLSRSGLGDRRKPVGSFLFAGPTGVGKTELTRQLAHSLGVELVRFDMSEYMERHTVSRLIGAPPGYVGFDQGGLLTDAVMKHPHCVVLLDEIEKAHPDIYNLLLQVMDHGTLTDNNGRKTDFRNVIIVMTTNAGAQEAGRASMGFVAQDHAGDALEAVKKVFTPEFRNRLDAIVQFRGLDASMMARVVDKFLTELQAQLDEKRVTLEVDAAARDWLARKGHDPRMGARPMARLIQEEIRRPLADQLLFGALAEGGVVRVSLEGEKLRFEFEALAASKA